MDALEAAMTDGGGDAGPADQSRRGFLALLLAGACGLAGCVERYGSYRYRLTLGVRCDGKLRTGSSVVEEAPMLAKSIEGTMSQVAIKGEGTFIDLGGGRALVALLTGEQSVYSGPDGRERTWTQGAFGSLTKAYDLPWVGSREVVETLRKQVGPRDLTLAQLPGLAFFRNVKDPNSAVRADPARLQDLLGDGAGIASATIEITEDAVTTGLRQHLPWLRRDLNVITGREGCYAGEPCILGYELSRGVD